MKKFKTAFFALDACVTELREQDHFEKLVEGMSEEEQRYMQDLCELCRWYLEEYDIVTHT